MLWQNYNSDDYCTVLCINLIIYLFIDYLATLSLCQASGRQIVN